MSKETSDVWDETSIASLPGTHEGSSQRNRICSTQGTMPANMITYRFFFEGLITEFGNNYRNRFFFPCGPIFEFGNHYRPFFPRGAIFESGKNA